MIQAKRENPLKKIKWWVWVIILFLILAVVYMLFSQQITFFLYTTGILGDPTAQQRFHIVEKVEFPQTTGEYDVGRTSFHIVDNDRIELFAPEEMEEKNRQLVITVFYPAEVSAGEDTSDYLPRKEEQAIADVFIKDNVSLDFENIEAGFYEEAPISEKEENYPVIIFSPGGGIQPQFYTSLMEEWASNGYIVFALSDSFSTPVVVLPDGSLIKPLKPAEYNEFMREAVLGDEEAREKVNEYLQNVIIYDIEFILKNLSFVNEMDSIFQGKMDITNIGVAGHSIGGISVFKAGVDVDYVNAILVFDGYLYYQESDTVYSDIPPMMMMHSDLLGIEEKDVELVEEMKETYQEYLAQSEALYTILIPGTAHMSFVTDLVLMEPHLEGFSEENALTIDLSAEEFVSVVREYSLSFFDQYLKSEFSELLQSGAEPLDSVEIEIQVQ